MANEPTDHLDESPSETVRRHAATFRSVRERLAAREAAVVAARVELEARAPGEGAWAAALAARVSDGDGLRVLGAGSAARVAKEAATNGWRVIVRVGQARRERDDAWIDSAVVVAYRGEGPGAEWVLGHWRADPVVAPYRRKWKFLGATAWDRGAGLRSVGAKELVAQLTAGIGS